MNTETKITDERALEVLRVVTNRAMQGSETREAYDHIAARLRGEGAQPEQQGQAVATTRHDAGFEPGPLFDPDAWDRLRNLPKGTPLFTRPQPVGAGAVRALADRVEALLTAWNDPEESEKKDVIVRDMRALSAAPAAPSGKLVAWWNGITPDITERTPGEPSIRWGAGAEDSGHDIPLYDGPNPIHYTSQPEAAPVAPAVKVGRQSIGLSLAQEGDWIVIDALGQRVVGERFAAGWNACLAVITTAHKPTAEVVEDECPRLRYWRDRAVRAEAFSFRVSPGSGPQKCCRLDYEGNPMREVSLGVWQAAVAWPSKSADQQPKPTADASDADIAAWVERHNLDGAISGTDARCAFEDAQTFQAGEQAHG